MSRLNISTISANSVAYGYAGRVIHYSRVIRLLLVVPPMANSILAHSMTAGFLKKRFWSLLQVNDYLDRTTAFNPVILEKSASWSRIRASLLFVVRIPSMIWDYFHLSGSKLLAKLPRPMPSGIDYLPVRKRVMTFFLIFATMFYTLRLILLLIIPGAKHYIGWGSGLILGFMLSALIILLERR